MQKQREGSILGNALSEITPSLKKALVFSAFTGILVLSPSAYMLEVYDRVVNSRNYMTLLMLTIAVIFAYILLELLEWVRAELMQEASIRFVGKIRDRIFNALYSERLTNGSSFTAQAVRDMDGLRDFLASRSMLSVIDTPIALVILVLLFIMNPLLGWFAVAGALVQFCIGYFNQRRIVEPITEANRKSLAVQRYANEVIRNAQVVYSMGMFPFLRERWVKGQQEQLFLQAVASDHAGTNAAYSKLVQSMLSSLLLGVGCWLTLKAELHGSGMIIGSILGGKVLSPMVQLIGSWRQIDEVVVSYRRLDALLEKHPEVVKGMALPEPRGLVTVEGLYGGAPGSKQFIVKGINFSIQPGGSLALLGSSASGKTTIARLLVGVWKPMQGTVRIDGHDVYQWDKDDLGPHIGYLPQNIELFEGTIGENISRFGEPDQAMLDDACSLVGLQSFIGKLPEGYDTQIGPDGAYLSGGERQRVALARAVYGRPQFLVLDEPDSSLDEAGDNALIEAIRTLRSSGATLFIITHRLNILREVEHMMILVGGQVQKFGTTDELLETVRPQQPQTPVMASAQS